MTEPVTQTHEQYNELVEEICWPDTQAARWVSQVREAANMWDHIIDEDELDREQANRVMMALVTEWGLNSFYTKYAHILTPLMALAVDSWKWSNKESSPKLSAFQIYTDIPLAVAYILGGQERVDGFSEKLRDTVLKMMEEDEIRDSGKK